MESEDDWGRRCSTMSTPIWPASSSKPSASLGHRSPQALPRSWMSFAIQLLPVSHEYALCMAATKKGLWRSQHRARKHSSGKRVGLPGLEPGTSALSVLRSNQLSYSPRNIHFNSRKGRRPPVYLLEPRL